MVLNRGEVMVLDGIDWIDIIKRITINAEDNSLSYKELKNVVDQLVENKVVDSDLRDEYKKKLEPVPYLVYGTKPPIITIEG